MPLYEYRCESCDEKEEKLEGFDAPKDHDCPHCGKAHAMHREVSLTSFTLAGGGWMAEGYGKGTPGRSTSSAAKSPAPACAGGCACHPSK
ncbi:MAG: zinc ribbon domain-containing protein [Holophaga sp.]|nr:zinc ribbon domain-containing protein [Holophaga sp.]